MTHWKTLIATFVMTALAPLAESASPLQDLTASYALQKSNLAAASEAQVKAPREKYLTALTAAQKSALAAARTADLAAIGSEIQAVGSNVLPEPAPPDLPRALLPDRRALGVALAAAERMVGPRLRELAMNYQRNLMALEDAARRSRDQALLDAIAAEKQRALSEVENSGGGQKNRNIVDNGDFSRGDGGPPAGWKRAHEWKEVSDAMVVSEGRDKFLRFRRLQAIQQSDLMPDKPLPVPARAKSAEVTFRMRVEGLVKGNDYDPWPGVHLSARDGRDESIAKEEAVLKESSSAWRRMTARLKLPDGTKTLRVTMGPFGSAGIVDFDDVAVEFK